MTGSVPEPAAVLDNLTTAVVVLDAAGHVRSLNAAAESLFGISLRHAVGRRIEQLHPDLEPAAALAARAAADDQSYGQQLTVRPATPAEPEASLNCRATPVHVPDWHGVILELVDATHWRQIDREQGLLSQQDVSRRLMVQLAHEIRNPLGGLRGAAQLLERRLPSDELREYTRIIIAEADRLTGLTEALLAPVRSPKREPANIHEILDRVIALLRIEADTVTFVRDYDPSLPPILADRDQVLQALLNIARNAVQAVSPLQEGGRIVFRSRALTSCLIAGLRHRVVANVEIEDNGPGISPQLGDSIFLPLVSGHEAGTGLGLPLAQEIVSRHGGLIEYRSRPGQTVFAVRLPLALDDVDAGRRG